MPASATCKVVTRETWADLVREYVKYMTTYERSEQYRNQTKTVLEALSAHSGVTDCALLTSRHVLDYLASRRSGGVSGKTLNDERAIVSQFYVWLSRAREFTGENPVSKVPRFSHVRRRYKALTVAQLRAFIDAARLDESKPLAKRRHRAMRSAYYIIGYATGLRYGTLARVCVGWVALDDVPPRINLPGAVGRKEREDRAIMLNDEAVRVLRPLIAGRDPRDLVFEKPPHPEVVKGDLVARG